MLLLKFFIRVNQEGILICCYLATVWLVFLVCNGYILVLNYFKCFKSGCYVLWHVVCTPFIDNEFNPQKLNANILREESNEIYQFNASNRFCNRRDYGVFFN